MANESVFTLFRKYSRSMLLFDYNRHNTARKLKSMFLAQNVTMSKRFLDFEGLHAGPDPELP